MLAVEQYLPFYSSNENCKKLKKIKIDGIVASKFKANTMKKYKRRVTALDKDIFLHFDEVAAGLQKALNTEISTQTGEIGLGAVSVGAKRGSYSVTSKEGVSVLLKNLQNLEEPFNAISAALTVMDTTMREGLGWEEGVVNLIQSGDAKAIENIGEGLYTLPKTISQSDLKTLASCRKKINENVAVLRSLLPSTGPVSSNVDSEEIRGLFAGIASCFNKIKGTLYEAEVLSGLLVADIQGLEYILHTGANSKDSAARILNDPTIKKDIQNNRQQLKALQAAVNGVKINNPKADLTLVLGEQYGSGTMGVSIKNTKKSFSETADRWKNSLSVGTHKNLLTQIKSAGHYLSMVTEIDPLYFGKMLYTVRSPKGNGLQPGTLNEYWYSYLDAVAFLNILDSLVGSGGFANSASILIVNNQVYSMEDVLKKITSNPELVYGHVRKSLTRASGVALNQWIDEDKGKNQESANKRSEQLHQDVNAAFAGATLQTKIDLSLLLMIMK